MSKYVHLLLIDPQNDFCDPRGTLFVPGAVQDMARATDFIRSVNPSEITITLDSHASVGIERVTFWKTGGGNDVAPFTQITHEQVVCGEIVPRSEEKLPTVIQYLHRLEAGKKYKLMAWPVHCVMGTWGHTIHDELMLEISAWEQRTQSVARRILKGMDPNTEQYSAVKPEVMLQNEVNDALVKLTTGHLASRLVVAGEASSHCVSATIRDLWGYMSSTERSQMILLRDAMSPVGGFEDEQAQFFNEARSHGVSILTCTEALAVLA